MNSGQDYLAELNVDRDDFWHKNKDRVLARYVNGPRVLDLGCGLGSLSILLAKQGKDVVGIDDSEEYLEIARRKSRGLPIRYVRMDFAEEDFPDRQPFDTVLLSGVIEHIEDDSLFLTRIRPLLKEGGILVLLTSAYPWLYSAFDRAVGHCRRYSKRRLLEALAKTGYKVRSVRYWDVLGLAALLLMKVFDRTILRPERLANRTLDRILDRWFVLFENRMLLPLGADLILVAEK